jgi:ATP-dependent RNA helicase DDX19/DBP5
MHRTQNEGRNAAGAASPQHRRALSHARRAALQSVPEEKACGAAMMEIFARAKRAARNRMAAAAPQQSWADLNEAKADGGAEDGADIQDKEVEVVLPNGAVTNLYRAAKSFQELGIPKSILDGVFSVMKWTAPTQIQAQSLPIALEARRPNLIAQAQNGAGKTGAYGLAVLSRIDERKETPQALCVVPTRELAMQVQEVLTKLSTYTKIKIFCAVQDSRKGPITEHVVVGTAGTVLNSIEKRFLKTDGVSIFVVDEADQMVSAEGQGKQTAKIKSLIAQRRPPDSVQTLLFSATFPEDVENLAKAILREPVRIQVKKEELTLEGVAQFCMEAATPQIKYKLLSDLYAALDVGQSVIFAHTIKTAKELANNMRKDGYSVSLLHGRGMDNAERDKAMKDFREGVTSVLITTNLAARGVSVEQVTLVINYELPVTRDGSPDPDTYLHRVGRTGRFGRKGVAINMLNGEKDKSILKAISQYFAKDIKVLPGDDIAKVSEIVKACL